MAVGLGDIKKNVVDLLCFKCSRFYCSKQCRDKHFEASRDCKTAQPLPAEIIRRYKAAMKSMAAATAARHHPPPQGPPAVQIRPRVCTAAATVLRYLTMDVPECGTGDKRFEWLMNLPYTAAADAMNGTHCHSCNVRPTLVLGDLAPFDGAKRVTCTACHAQNPTPVSWRLLLVPEHAESFVAHGELAGDDAGAGASVTEAKPTRWPSCAPWKGLDALLQPIPAEVALAELAAEDEEDVREKGGAANWKKPGQAAAAVLLALLKSKKRPSRDTPYLQGGAQGRLVREALALLRELEPQLPNGNAGTDQESTQMTSWDLVGALRTVLHLDWADAVNVAWRVVWDDADVVDADEVLCRWHCFGPGVLKLLEDWVLSKYGRQLSGGDAHHLSDEDVEAFQSTLPRDLRKQVVVLEQKHGYVVKIPAGWLHQVTNRRRCMKVAYDVCDINRLAEYIAVWHDLIVPYLGYAGRIPAAHDFGNVMARDYAAAQIHASDECGRGLRRLRA